MNKQQLLAMTLVGSALAIFAPRFINNSNESLSNGLTGLGALICIIGVILWSIYIISWKLY